MDAKEIRVGNIVGAVGIKDDWYQINESVLGQFLMYDECDHIKPIPLTEEWLLRFGFEKGKLQKWFGNGHDYQPVDVYTELYAFTMAPHEFEYHIRTWTHSGIAEDESCAVYCGDNLVVCDHVHQLQNLYFALTSEELTIK